MSFIYGKKKTDLICPIKDLSLKKSFVENGFIVLNNLSLPFMDKLYSLSLNYIKQKEQTFQYSLMEHSYEENLILHQKLIELLHPLFNSIFDHYLCYSGSLLIKPSLSGNEMDLHQDWTFTDELKFTPCTVWIPLQNTNKHNGCLFFLPGSHRIFSNFRSHDYETARIPKDLFENKVKNIEVKKGDIVVFNPSCFHGSFANNSEQVRVAISITILDEKAPFLHVKKESENVARIFKINDDCFFKDLAQLNEKYIFESNSFESLEYSHHVPTVQEIILKLATYV